MEKTGQFVVKKQEHLLAEINELEIQITAMRNKILLLENEEKIVNYKKNFLETKKYELNSSIEFYTKYSKRTNEKLANKLNDNLTFSAANDCYDRLLEVYREKYLQEIPDFFNENLLLHQTCDTSKLMDKEMKKTEKLQLAITANSKTIKDMLEDLHRLLE